MKPDWDKLGQAYADSDSVMIVDVDCTAAGEATCQKMGVKGYPTIKYYMAGKNPGKDYNGGRDFSALKSFVGTTLDKAVCNVVTKKGCQKSEVEWIEKMEVKSLAEIQESLKSKTDELSAINSEQKQAAKEHAEKEKEWKKKEKNLVKATGFLKKLEVEAKKKATSDEL